MFVQLDLSFDRMTEEAAHVQVEDIIVAIGHADGNDDGNRGAGPFAALPHERLFGDFALLDLATRKLPSTC